jgi:hypothetical protein
LKNTATLRINLGVAVFGKVNPNKIHVMIPAIRRTISAGIVFVLLTCHSPCRLNPVMEEQMVSKSHATKTATPKAKALGEKMASLRTKASVQTNIQTKTTDNSKSRQKTPPPQATQVPKHNFLVPLPKGFHTKLLEGKAEEANGERKIKLKVMASLYSGHDYSQAAEANNVPLGNVYLWLADFRRGGLAAL